MTEIINLQSNAKYHFGAAHSIKSFEGCWFEEIEPDVNNKFINKVVIIETKYEPNEVYNRTDGYAGNCWEAILTDSCNDNVITFRFRDFVDLIIYYEKLGFKFVKI